MSGAHGCSGGAALLLLATRCAALRHSAQQTAAPRRALTGWLDCIADPLLLNSNLLILISTVALCMETMESYNPSIHPSWDATWSGIELFCVTMFSVDLFFRCAGAGYAKKFGQFWGDPMNWVDLLAVLPWYLELVFSDVIDLRFVRVIRLARILRALRSPRFQNMGAIIGDIIRNSAAALAIPIYFMMLALVLFSSLVYYAEEAQSCATAAANATAAGACKAGTGALICDLPLCDTAKGKAADACAAYKTMAAAQKDGCINKAADTQYITYDGVSHSSDFFTSIPDTFWWCIVTFTTVGYGDKYPRTMAGRILGAITMFFGIFFIAMPLTIVGSSFSASWEKIKNKTDSDAAKAAESAENAGDGSGSNNPLYGVKVDIAAHMSRIQELLDECNELSAQDTWGTLKEKLTTVEGAFDATWEGISFDK